jgi:hypothetical protein
MHVFLTSALAGSEWSASRLCRFTLRETAPSTHWIGGLDYVEMRKFLTLPEFEVRPLGCPGRSQSLYRLSYRGS